MKLEFQNKWVRLLIELLPEPTRIHRYRVMPRSLEVSTQRALSRRISRQLRQEEEEAAT